MLVPQLWLLPLHSSMQLVAFAVNSWLLWPAAFAAWHGFHSDRQ